MTVTLGPLTLPVALLVTFAAIFLGSAVGNRVAASRGVKAEGALWLVIAGAVLAARAAFVAQYWSLYASEPWRVPDLRDGGLTPAAGLLAALLIGGALAWRRAPQRTAIVTGVLAGVFVWLGGTGLAGVAGTVNPRQTLPAMTLADLDGRNVVLAAPAGKPLVVNIWASWCPPCRREMPVLSKAQTDSPDVHFVFVNQGESAATIRDYLKAEGLALRNVLRDPTGALAGQLGAPGLPMTLFFDANGVLVGKRMGELSPATLAEQLRALGAEGPSTTRKLQHP